MVKVEDSLSPSPNPDIFSRLPVCGRSIAHPRPQLRGLCIVPFHYQVPQWHFLTGFEARLIHLWALESWYGLPRMAL